MVEKPPDGGFDRNLIQDRPVVAAVTVEFVVPKLDQNLNNEDSQAVESTTHFENNNLSCPRKGESSSQSRFRANRLFTSGSAWYFSTREGRDQGPFINKEQAEIAISEFIKKVQN